MVILMMVLMMNDDDGDKQCSGNVDCAFQREDKYFQDVVNQIAHKRNLFILGHIVILLRESNDQSLKCTLLSKDGNSCDGLLQDVSKKNKVSLMSSK